VNDQSFAHAAANAWGIIGGTGLDQLDGLRVEREELMDTPYGATSAPLVYGHLGSTPMVFLARHGTEHHIAPHRINYRANIWALAQRVKKVVAVAAVGGIRAEFAPREVIIPDQIIDYTYGREHTFFDAEELKHIDFTAPYAQSVRQALMAAASGANARVYAYGCYGATQGPRLETTAEINRMERDGCDLVGMTGMPEAALARELELAYGCCAVVVNEAAGRGPDVITMDDIGAHLAAGMSVVRRVLAALSPANCSDL